MPVGRPALVDDLRPQLRREVRGLLAADAEHVALPVLQPRRLADEEAEQVLVRLPRHALARGVALLPPPQPALRLLVREEVGVGVGPRLRRLRVDGGGPRSGRAMRRQRGAGVDQVLDAVPPVLARVLLDAARGRADPAQERGVRDLEVAAAAEEVDVRVHVRDDQQLHDGGVAVEQVRLRRPGVEHELVDAREPAVVVRPVLVEGAAEAPVRVAARQAAGDDVVHAVGRRELEDRLARLEAVAQRGGVGAPVEPPQLVELRRPGHQDTSSSGSGAKIVLRAFQISSSRRTRVVTRPLMSEPESRPSRCGPPQVKRSERSIWR